MKCTAYDEYKPSGIEWLGNVPAHWTIARSDGIVSSERRQVQPDVFLSEDVFHYSIPLVQEIGTGAVEEGESIKSAKQPVFRKSLLVSKLNPRKATIVVAEPQPDLRTLCSTEFVTLFADRCDLGFLTYVTLSEAFRQRLDAAVQSVTRSHQRANPRDIYSFWNAWPPLDEQQSIARFLDAKTAQIDALVAQKRQLIEKLKEKRQALIARTVTRGLPPEAAKAAGLEMDSDSKCSKEIHPLIGSLPMGWRSLKLRRVATVQGGYAFKSDDFQQEGIPVVRMNSLKRGVLELEGAACIDESECIEAVALRIGDVLYGMSGSVGETGSLGNFAVVRDSDVPCQLNQRVGRFLVRKKELLLGFLVYLIQAPYFYDQILLQATGTAQFNVSGGQIESVLIALPPLEAQRLMVDFLDARCAEIDALQRKTEQALESLYEFRTAIVTSAVTGKIDVRGAT